MYTFENRTKKKNNRKKIRLFDYNVLNFQENQEYIGDFESIGENDGTSIDKESIFDIIEQKVEYVLENPLTNLEKARFILNRVSCISEAYKSFTLEEHENVTWSLYDPFDERVRLENRKVIFEKVKEDTILKVIATATYENAEASKTFEIILRRTNPNYSVVMNNLEWFHIKDELSYSNVNIISTNNIPLYLDVTIENPYIMEKNKVLEGVRQSCVIFKERSEASIITGLNSLDLNFNIKVYTDENKTNCVGEIADSIVYSYEIYKPESTTANWIEGEALNSSTFKIISPSNENLYCEVTDVDQKLNVEITKNGGNLILIQAREKRTGISGEAGVTIGLSFKVKIYNNSNCYDDYHVGTIKYTIYYTYNPTDPID